MVYRPTKYGRRLSTVLVVASVLTVQARAFAAPSYSAIRAWDVPRNALRREGAKKWTRRFSRHSSQQTSLQASAARHSAIASGTRVAICLLKLRGGGGEVSDLAMGAYDWCTNLCGPSALVAGAVIATIYDNMGTGALDINSDVDSKRVIFGKRVARLLLLSAFAFEVLSIFLTTVTGTMLLSHTEATLDARMPTKPVTKETTPLSFLHDNFEFEYLTARITFLQGLLNWLGAIALGHILPSGESTDSRVMNQFIGLSLLLLMVIWWRSTTTT